MGSLHEFLELVYEDVLREGGPPGPEEGDSLARDVSFRSSVSLARSYDYHGPYQAITTVAAATQVMTRVNHCTVPLSGSTPHHRADLHILGMRGERLFLVHPLLPANPSARKYGNGQPSFVLAAKKEGQGELV